MSAIVQVGNVAIVGGAFTQVAENGGSGPAALARNNIAAFDTTTGEPLAAWAPDVNGEVAALAVSPDGSKIYAGGAFTTVDGLARTRLVALDAATGAVDTTWKPAAGYTVEALVVSGGRMYIGGAFTTIGGKPRPYLAAVDATTGKLDAAWAPAASAKVRALAASPDGSRIYAGGDFTTVAGVTRKNLAALDPVTGAVLDWNPAPNYPVFGIAVDSSHVFTAGGGSANSLASWDPSTATRRWVKTSDGDFQAIGISGGIVYAGGHFLYYDGHLEPKRIVAVDADTGNLRPDWFTRVRGGTEGVWAISVSADRVLLGGDFTDVGLEPHAHYAQFDGPTDGPVEAEEPTAPADLFAGAVGGSKVNLSWQASTDDVGVSGYVVLRDGVEIGRSGAMTYADESVQAGTRYTYAVRAFDSAGHLSAPSNSAAVITGPLDQVLTFSPTDDAYVDSAVPDNNSGTSTTMKVDGDPLKETLLKFAVSGVGNRQVVSAKLRLYCTDSSNDGGHVHRASTSDWSENTVTWNTSPTALFPEITDLSDVDAGKWYTVDVTPLVTGDGDVSAVIDSMISNAAQYASKDGTTGNGPQLVVNVATASALPFNDGFETRDFSQWTSVTGLVTQQDEVFSGGWAARAATTGPARFATKDLTETQTDVYQQLRFKILSQGVNSVVLLRPRTNTGASLLKLYLDSAGRLAYRNDVAGTTATSTIKPAKGAWHTLQLHTSIDGAPGQAEVWLDGTKLTALSKTESLGTTPIGRLQLGEDSTGRTYDIAYDDVTVDSTFIPDTSPPSVPAGLIASAPSAHEADLAWAAATDDIGVAIYEIYRDGALIDTVGGAVTSFVDRGVEPDTTYEYAVQAIDAARNSSGSSEPVSVTTPPPDTTPPSTPTGLTATAVSFDRVDLSWSASSDDVGVDRYRVYRDGTLIATVGASASSYRDTDVAASTDYVYTVDAVDAAGNASGRSDPAAARTLEQAVFREGFESGDLSQWTNASGLTVDGTETFGGAFGARATTTSAAAYATKQLSTGYLELYYLLRFNVLSQGANSIVLGRLRTASGSGIVKLYLDGNAKLAYRNDVAGTTSTSSSVPSRQTWHTVQLHALVDASAGQVELWLDGARILSKAEPLGDVAIGRVELGDGATGRTYDVAYDDVAIDTAMLDTVAPSVSLVDLADGSVTAAATPAFAGAAGTAAGDADTVYVKVHGAMPRPAVR